MNRPPEILINNGFPTDANGVLTGIVIPNNVVTQNAPSIVTTYATTINWIPSNAATLVEFNALNLSNITDANAFKYFTKLERVSISGMTSLIFTSTEGTGYFYGCSNLVSVSMPDLINLGYVGASGSYCGVFFNCKSLSSVSMPKLENIYMSNPSSNHGNFYNCIGLEVINFPSIKMIQGGNLSDRGTFRGCVSLTDVTLGSDGHPVSSIGAYTFSGCTQSNLTITIYTQGGAALSGEPWGATNATIEYEEA